MNHSTDNDLNWPNGMTPLDFALALSSQPNRTSLTHCFGHIMRQFYKPCRVFIFGSDNGRRIESERDQDLSKVRIRNLLQPIESLELYCLDDIDGAVDTIEQKKPTTCQLTDVVSRIVWPIQGRGGICNLLVIDYTMDISASQLGLSNVIQLFENLLHIFDQAERDSLTGLLNRLAFDKSMENLQVQDIYYKNNQSKKQRQRYFAMLDIDHFKLVNDEFGHLYGDEVLLYFAKLLTESFRRNDWIFRFGGEEFSVVLEVSEPEQVSYALERFRKKVEMFDFPIVGKVTVSVGFTRINSGETLSHIIDKADKALYYAKGNGRNKVIRYEQIFTDDIRTIHTPQQSDITIF